MPNKSEKKFRIWEPLVVGISAAIGLLAGYNMNFNNNDYSLLSINQSENISINKDGRIEEILRFIETNYVDSLNQDVIAVDAIRHILKQLDPHSSYISPEELADHNEKMDGEYNGIGIETIELNDTFYISKLLNDAPAKNDGIKLGDAIISINGDLVAGNKSSFDKIRSYFKSRENDLLEIEVLPVSQNATHIIKVRPEVIVMASANSSYMIDEETAYIQMTRFSANTYEQFMQSIEKLIADKPEMNLILDLRDNPGGFLPEAINILSQMFDEKDKLLCFTEGLNRKKSDYFSTGKNFYKLKKIAVLINEYAASGSEIVAGAIQDWDRGIVIGNTSYGKGLVQEIFPLKNGGALRLTVAKYYTPSGRLIQKSYRNINKSFESDSNEYRTLLLDRNVDGGGGIVPDIVVEDNFNDYCYNLMGYADYFLLYKMKQNRSDSLNFTDFNSSKFVDFVINEFGDDLKVLEANCTHDLSDFINARYMRMSQGETSYLRYINENDNYVREAMDFMNDRKTTMALLSKEN